MIHKSIVDFSHIDKKALLDIYSTLPSVIRIAVLIRKKVHKLKLLNENENDGRAKNPNKIIKSKQYEERSNYIASYKKFLTIFPIFLWLTSQHVATNQVNTLFCF